MDVLVVGACAGVSVRSVSSCCIENEAVVDAASWRLGRVDPECEEVLISEVMRYGVVEW